VPAAGTEWHTPNVGRQMTEGETKPLREAKQPELLSDQYAQYWEMVRFHLSLSWNIPTLAIACIVAVAAIDPDAKQKWLREPLLPAVIVLVAALFMFLLYIHHRRNLLFAGRYEEAIDALEQKYGLPLGALHPQVQKKLMGVDRLSSSSCLGVFIVILGVCLMAFDVYLWILAL
jgi:hypothetical protein